MDTSIRGFVESIIEEKGISGISPEVRTQMIDDLSSRAEELINAEILTNLPPEALLPFEELLDHGTPEKIQEFCTDHIPNLDSVVANALISLRKKYLSGLI